MEGGKIIGICLVHNYSYTDQKKQVKDSGIGLINGEIYIGKMKSYDGKIPRVGWSEVEDNKGTYYFMHSYCMVPIKEDRYIMQRCKDDKIVASIRYDNMLAVQFHQKKVEMMGKCFSRANKRNMLRESV